MGRPLTDDEVFAIDQAFPKSAIPEAFAAIVDGMTRDDDENDDHEDGNGDAPRP